MRGRGSAAPRERRKPKKERLVEKKEPTYAARWREMDLSFLEFREHEGREIMERRAAEGLHIV